LKAFLQLLGLFSIFLSGKKLGNLTLSLAKKLELQRINGYLKRPRGQKGVGLSYGLATARECHPEAVPNALN
jgi:hypothetical protein